MTDPTMKKTAGDGVELALAMWEGKGETVLCVHGISGNCRCWDHVAEALAPQYDVLAMDLRGRGLSEKPASGYSVSYHCRDIHALLNHENIDQVVILGHSLGALIGLEFTAKFPEAVERLILVDGGGQLSAEQRKKVFAGIQPTLDRLGKIFPSNEAYRIMTDKKEHLARVMTEEQGKPLKAVVRGLLNIWKRNWAAFLCKK